MKNIKGIDVLLASWDAPRYGEQAYRVMDESLSYLERIHEAVMSVARSDSSLDPMDLCTQVVQVLGLPEMAANPLVARSFQANLAAKHHESSGRP